MKYLKNKKGQVMIELVLCIALILFFIGTIFSGNQIMHSKSVITLASYEAVREYSGFTVNEKVSGTDLSTLRTQKASLAKEKAQEVIDEAGMNFVVDSIDIGDYAGDKNYAQATIKGRVKLIWPMLDPTNPAKSIKELTISNTYVMRKENTNTSANPNTNTH